MSMLILCDTPYLRKGKSCGMNQNYDLRCLFPSCNSILSAAVGSMPVCVGNYLASGSVASRQRQPLLWLFIASSWLGEWVFYNSPVWSAERLSGAHNPTTVCGVTCYHTRVNIRKHMCNLV